MATKQGPTNPSGAADGQLGGIELAPDAPTEIPLSALDVWVIWQFPRLRQGWLCGAVHPPIEGYGWLPASIHPAKEKVLVHGHVSVPFTDPESAADWVSAQA